jgi:hypothetical protein
VAQETAALQSAYQSSASTYDAAVDSFTASPPNVSGDTNYDFVVNDEATVFHDANTINDASVQLSIGGLLADDHGIPYRKGSGDQVIPYPLDQRIP